MTRTWRDLADHQAIYRLSCLYARGADRRDPRIWQAIMTDDMVLISTGHCLEGRDNAIKGLKLLEDRFLSTQHRICNQLYDIEGDQAVGETYCIADHLRCDGEGRTIVTWTIRYQDRLRRIDGHWFFARRELILDWHDERRLAADR
jgi:hypothetical protein